MHSGSIQTARPTELVRLFDGDEYQLEIAPVAKTIGDDTVEMLGYNGSIPGPTLVVSQGDTVIVHVANRADAEATVHWHGLRLDNRYDGTHETQSPIPVGGTFSYHLRFPDPGAYWYHPHLREDRHQELGLYGNILVRPADPDYWPPASRELLLTLDDLLLENGAVAAFDSEATHVAMGRFGNTMLVGGDVEPAFAVRRGDVVRLYLTNTANTRVFNVALPGALLKLVGGDAGRVEHETLVDSVLLAPSERAVVDALFADAGDLTLEHRTPRRTYPLARVSVAPEQADAGPARAFSTLRTNDEMARLRTWTAPFLDAAPDKTLAFVAELDLAGAAGEGTSAYACPMHDHSHHGHGHAGHDDRIEWEDDMVEINRITTPANTRWKLVDRETGAVNSAIAWTFRVGDAVKLRLVNEPDSDHPMPHPFHVHGAGRMLILSRDGVVEPNLVWKDTVLVRTGETVDVLLEVTNPGRWMAHCHIAEHHEAGMRFSFDVVAPTSTTPTINRDAPVVGAGEIEIAAAPSVVWDVLTALERWPGWSRGVKSISVQGPIVPGSVFRWRAAGATPITSTILGAEAPNRIVWTGRTVGIRARHAWYLEPRGDATVVRTEEALEGLLARLVPGPLQKALDRSLQDWLRCLKAEVERQTPSRTGA